MAPPPDAEESRMIRRAWPLAFAVAGAVLATARADNWPQWRGPTGDGISAETNLPLKWSERENVAWKCPLPPGASTPAVWGDAVFVTGHDGDKLMLFRIDRDTGKVAWSREVATGRNQPQVPGAKRGDVGYRFHKLYDLASPSPVTDGERVIAHFGTGDLAAYDFAGKELWKRNLQADHGRYTVWYGHANSPVLFGDLVINACIQDSLADEPDRTPADSYLVAYDKRTGERRWKALRKTEAKAEQCDAYTTPLLRTVNDRRELVVMGGNQLDAYDPATGRQLWYLTGLDGGRLITGPTAGGGLVFATRGMKGNLVAVRPDGNGRQPEASIVWQQRQSTADSSSPVYHNGLLYWITDNGILNCVDAATGQPRWDSPRLAGDFKASPLVAAGRLYFLNLSGRCTVVAAGPKFEKLAENAIDDETIASPAAADGRLYLRGRSALYCIR
jgi:outer membrane protein assembly factor BamB